LSDCARKLIGIETLNAGSESWTGKGEIIAVVDSGIDASHPDFDGRIAYKAPGPLGGEVDDHIGHGTHVAGTAAGSGAASGGKIRGMAPEATLVVVGITDDDGDLKIPPDFGDVLEQAAKQGAKVINLSLEAAIASEYDNHAKAVDSFMREHPDVLVVVAAGNEGNAEHGYPYLRSVGTPASAKNVLTVGACASDRPGFEETWETYDSNRFGAEPVSVEKLAGDPDLLAAFSSRGPSDFDAVKPDVVAPGTAILAPRADGVPERRFWRLFDDFGGRYAFMNGTSMAAPVASGAAAIVCQVLRTKLTPPLTAPPSAALIKAVMIASAQRLGTTPFRNEDFGYPDFDQGFGRLDLARVLPGEHAPPGRRLWVEDVPNVDDRALESRAQLGAVHKATRRYRFKVGAGKQPLRAVLCWTDFEQAAVQNCLALELQGPGGLRVRGNEGHLWQVVPSASVDPRFLAHQIDRRNNVQAIGVEEAAEGAYTLTVFASNTLFPPQGYAFCVCAEVTSDPESR